MHLENEIGKFLEKIMHSLVSRSINFFNLSNCKQDCKCSNKILFSLMRKWFLFNNDKNLQAY